MRLRRTHCSALPDARSIAAVPTGAWVIAGYGLRFVGLDGVASDRTRTVRSGKDSTAPYTRLRYDSSRDVVWVALPDELVALVPATGAIRRRWAWEGWGAEWIDLAPGGLWLFRSGQLQFARFD